MMNKIRSSAILLAVLSISSAASAQWTNVASNILGPLTEYGSMAFRDGVVWAGVSDLYMSKDSGQTWTALHLNPAGHINDIEFFDRSIGMVATNAGAFLTTDEGATWTSVGDPLKNYVAAGFGPNKQDLFLTASFPSVVSTSTDGGSSWTTYNFGNFGVMTRLLKNGWLASLTLHTGLGGKISISTDFGQTWQPRVAHTKFDCYNVVGDLCDENRLYVVNEEVYVQTDGFAQLYTSTDVGGSWSEGAKHVVRYFNGSIEASPNALYMGTCANGVQRSTDRGLTWSSIAGPSAPPDTRDLVAIDDNIILGADVSGSIWRTMNSGGTLVVGSEAPLAFQNPFANAVPTTSCGVIDTVLYAVVTSCGAATASLSDVSIEGSSHFSLLGSPQIGQDFTNSEPIRVGYSAIGSGADSSYLRVKYKIGSRIRDTTILLTAHGFAPRAASTFSVGTIHAKPTDHVDVRVAASVARSISLSSVNVKSITYHLSYSSDVIDMAASMATSLVTSRTGWTIGNAIVSHNTLVVTENNVTNEKLGDSVYLGSARFTALSSAMNYTTVYLDQLDIRVDTGVIHLCVGGESDYLANVSVGSSSVTSSPSLVTNVSIYPNPAGAHRSATLELNIARAEELNLQLFDLLGREVLPATVVSVVRGRNKIAVNLGVTAGTYYMRINTRGSTAWAVTKKLIVQ